MEEDKRQGHPLGGSSLEGGKEQSAGKPPALEGSG